VDGLAAITLASAQQTQANIQRLAQRALIAIIIEATEALEFVSNGAENTVRRQ
jgi:hypothetical protein